MRFIRFPELKAKTGLGRTTIYGLVGRGLLTKPVAISERAKGWPDPEIEILSAARLAEKSEAEIRALVVELHAARKAADRPAAETRDLRQGATSAAEVA